MVSLSPHLTVNLGRIQENYATLCKLSGTAEATAVLKADAYGLGAVPIARALAKAGCKTFWVARTDEALPLRKALPHATLYVLGGPEEELLTLYEKHRLRPVLNTQKQLDLWIAFARENRTEPAALHVETGMHRFSLQQQEVLAAQKAWKQGALNLSLILSHLACVEEIGHPLNKAQLAAFEEIKKLFPSVPCSLAASYGVVGETPDFLQDITRTGRILYGITSEKDGSLVTPCAVTLSAPILQIKTVATDRSVGYGATWTAPAPRKIATLGIGYADGLPRSFQEKGRVYFKDGTRSYAAPVAGRVSMDLLTCDVTDIPEACLQDGAHGFLFDEEHDLVLFSKHCGLLSYEALTHFNGRVARFYVEG